MTQKKHFFTSTFTFPMSLITHFPFRRYPFSLICLALIWLLSLMPFFPETPLDSVAFIDKWTHLVMYGGTAGVMWIEHLRAHRHPMWSHLLLYAVAGMILLGGVIELIQAYCTTTRSGEWLDFLADSVGVLLGAAFGIAFYFVRKSLRKT
jgi:VanZ family protein